MVDVLIPLYISVLVDPASSDLRTFPQNRQLIHSHFLQRVTEIGPKYPEAFRNVMQVFPASKAKLEAAVRASHSAKGSTQSAKGSARTQRGFTQAQQPSIKLKMDFSNFK